MSSGGHHSTHQLAEFLGVVSGCPDVSCAMQCGIERAAEALNADIAAIVSEQRVLTSLGLAGEPELERAVLDLAPRSATVDAGEFGPCIGVSVPLERKAGARLVVARLGTDRFPPEEVGLISGMARVLSLTLGLLESLESERSLRLESERHAADNARLAGSLERRRRLLEAASEIERAISRRAPLQEVLDAVIAGARDLLKAEPVALWLRDPQDPDYMLMASSFGFSRPILRQVRRTPIGQGAGGQVMVENRLVVLNDYRSTDTAIGPVAGSGVTAAMGAPVHENGKLVGALVVGSRTPDHVFTQEQQEILLAFAEHASLALTDARTVERMNEALHDSLTGLPNRGMLLDKIAAAVQERRGDGGATILFVDLDRFKLVNDSFGHSFGDRLLVTAANRLRALLAPGDTVARLGGDEFVVLLEDGAERERAIEVAEMLLESLLAPFQIDGRELYITASIGIALGTGEPAELVARADLAMYRAKRNGSSRYAMYEPSM
jgi:diguanylate cyclase (GGDEF)-like protein